LIQETIQFNSREEWRNWLFDNCKAARGVWLIFRRKSGAHGPEGLLYREARDEALCFGWIDSTVKGVDGERIRQYFSPRRPRSFWSAFNKNKIAELIDQNLMTAYGLEAIEKAKANGSYFLSDLVEDLVIPEELEREFSTREDARKAFDGLTVSRKKRILYGLVILKTEAARKRKIDLLMGSLVEGQKSYPSETNSN
jgi:uncharacterized protein YdeI (YjbR/CyaY-like superfamily)